MSQGSTVVGQPGTSFGSMTLQQAYDNDTVAPQLTPLLTEGFEIAGRLDLDGALTQGNATAMVINDTFSPGAFIGGVISSTGTVTYTSTTFIWALLSENKLYVANAGAGFAAFTLFNALAAIRTGTSNDVVQALILNNGVAHQSNSAAAGTVTQNIGLSNSPNTRALVAFGSMTKTTGDTAVRHSPSFGTVALSSIAFGTQRGLHCLNPAVGLFQPSAGTETMTAYIGLDFENITFGGNVTKRAVRSFLSAATNARFLDGQGTAQSDLRGSLNFPVDLVGIQYGASLDWFEAWAAGGFKIEQQASPVGQYRKSFPTTARMLKDWSVDMELTVNCQLGFSLGAQTGANGNQFGNFVAGAQSVSVGGEYSQFLLTQAGNVTADAALSLVAGWTVNAPSITLGTGTVTAAGVLNVGGNVNQGSVDRFGIRVLSNPSGGSGVNAALWITAGLSRFDGRVDINNGIALGGGATATLGTIGGSGPTAAAQAQWVEIDIGGVAHWIPAWT